MRRVAYTLTALPLLVLGCVTADIGDGDDPGLGEIDLQVDNGIFLENGLKLPNGIELPNGVALTNGIDLANGIDLPNGIDLANGIELPNGVSGPYYAPPAGSGLEQWIDVDPPMRKKTLRYLVECALPRGVEVQLRYRGTLETLGRGILGLGPTLQKGAMPAAEQEKVSSCLLARVNGQGIAASIDMFAPMSGMNTATAAELDTYAVSEGVFFGNLFASTPQAYACSLEVDAMREFRACPDSGGCGIVAMFWTFERGWSEEEHQTYTRTVLSDCFANKICSKASLGAGYGYARSCSAGGRTWSYPITTHLAPADIDEQCFGGYHCMDGLTCSGDTCYLPQ